MYLKDDDYYEFVGWTKDIDNFKKWADSNSKIFTSDEVKEIIKKVITDAELYREDMLKYETYGHYEFQVLENTALSNMRVANKYLNASKDIMILFGRYLGGAYVFKKIY